MKQVPHVRDEKALLAQLAHPNVVNLLAWFQDAARLFLVLEFVAGASLSRVLSIVAATPPRKPTPPPPSTVGRVCWTFFDFVNFFVRFFFCGLFRFLVGRPAHLGLSLASLLSCSHQNPIILLYTHQNKQTIQTIQTIH